MNQTIKILRNKNNYSQSSVADYLGISRQMYIKYETGAVELSVKTIRALATLYKVPADVIFDDKLTESSHEVSYFIHDKSVSAVAEPQTEYGVSSLNQIMKLLPKLSLKEKIDLMAELASMIQREYAELNNPDSINTELPQKNKKIPDCEYTRSLK